MFDIAWTELMLIGVVALVVIGPKDLPKVVYELGKWVRKARMVAREFQTHVDDMMREAELEEIRQQALKARDMNLTRMVENTVDPQGTLRSAFDPPVEAGSATAAPVADPAATQPVPATEPPILAPPQVAAAEEPMPATAVGAPPAVAAATTDHPPVSEKPV